MIRIATICLALLPAATAAAQDAMSAAEFERYVTGKTLTFSTGGTPYGQEEYREDRQVRWSFLNGECREGEWFARGEQICFVYEGRPDPQCWSFYRGDRGLRARFAGSTEGELYETRSSDEPMRCLGPEVGV